MYRVQNGILKEQKLPKNDYLKNGQAVSGYKNLPEKRLKTEGWIKEVKEVKPILKETQELGKIIFEKQKDEWIKTYEVKEKPEPVEPTPDPIEELKKRIELLENKESEIVVKA